MTTEKKDVLLINHGGNAGQERDLEGKLQNLSASRLGEKLHQEVRDRLSIGYLDMPVLNSSDATTDNWGNLARAIFDGRKEYNSVVVAFGTNTLADAATACAFALGSSNDIPVVFHGSQRHHGRWGSDALANLEDGISAAEKSFEQRVGEVMVVAGGNREILRGCCTLKRSDEDFQIFHSPACLPLTRITAHELNYGAHARRWDEQGHLTVKPYELTLRPNFDMNGIVIHDLYPGLEAQTIIRSMEDRDCRALIMYTFEEGNVPTRFLRVIELAHSRDVPVIVAPYFSEISPSRGVPIEDQNAIQEGAISGGNMTRIATRIKVAFLLAQTEITNNPALFRKAMTEDLVGERTVISG